MEDWDNILFIHKRIVEQEEYLEQLKKKWLTRERRKELQESAEYILWKFNNRFEELAKQKGYL